MALRVAIIAYYVFAPVGLKLPATAPALANAFFISPDVMASVVFKSVTPPPAAAMTDTATPSYGPSETVKKSYSPRVM